MPSGSITVDPLEDTTYTLFATNTYGFSRKSCSVTVENGADIIMISGPTWKEDDWRFLYVGEVKNQGTYRASYVKVYIYLYDINGNIIESGHTYIDKMNLDPGKASPWQNQWWDKTISKDTRNGS